MLLSDLSVHREQAKNCVSFFNPYSAEQLADLMLTHQPMPRSSSQAREKIAIEASEERVRQYAADFSCTLERSLSLFR
jgi:hypothetical protein